MNRKEAAYIIELGKEAIEKIDNIPGEAGRVFRRWVENWRVIESYVDGKSVEFNGSAMPSPDFEGRPDYYEILETKIDWKKVVENGGLHVRLVASDVPCRLVGVSKTGTPIVQGEDGLGIFPVGTVVFFHDEVETRSEWYELAEGE